MASSEYFENVLLDGETSRQLDFVDSKILEDIIRFCYIGQIRLTPVTIEAVLLAANKLRMKSLKSVCSQFFESTLDVDNCLHYALMAEKCGLNSSKELAQKFFANNCSRICKFKEFSRWNTLKIDEFIGSLTKEQSSLFDDLIKQIQSNENKSLLPEMFFKDLFPAIFRTFVSVR